MDPGLYSDPTCGGGGKEVEETEPDMTLKQSSYSTDSRRILYLALLFLTKPFEYLSVAVAPPKISDQTILLRLGGCRGLGPNPPQPLDAVPLELQAAAKTSICRLRANRAAALVSVFWILAF